MPDEPYRAKGAGSEVGLHPTLHIRLLPPLACHPPSSVLCVKHTEHIRPAYSSLVPQLPLTALVEVLNIAAAQSAQKAKKDKGKGKAKAGGSSGNLPSKGNKKKGGKK